MKVLFLLGVLSTLLLAESASVRGVVTDTTGALVPSATVTLTGQGRLRRIEVTGPQGSYTFANLPPGAYTLEASAPQLILAPTRINLAAGPNTIDLQLTIA